MHISEAADFFSRISCRAAWRDTAPAPEAAAENAGILDTLAAVSGFSLHFRHSANPCDRMQGVTHTAATPTHVIEVYDEIPHAYSAAPESNRVDFYRQISVRAAEEPYATLSVSLRPDHAPFLWTGAHGRFHQAKSAPDAVLDAADAFIRAVNAAAPPPDWSMVFVTCYETAKDGHIYRKNRAPA